MKINQRNRMLAALLVVQVLLAAFLLWPRSNGASASGSLFGDLQIDDITSLTIRDATSGDGVTLVKKADGWVLADADDFPAMGAAIESLLEKVINIRTSRLVARTSSSHRQLKVDEEQFERRIDFDANGQQHTLYIGSSVGSLSAHVRAGDQDQVYLTNDLAYWQISTAVSGWIDTTYLSVNNDDIETITLENASGTYEFDKGDDSNWTMKGLAEDETFNPNNLSTLVSRLASLSMTRPLGKEEKPEYGFDQPSAVVTFTTETEEEGTTVHTLRFGALDEETNQVVVQSSESPYYVLVNYYNVDTYINRTRDEFILPPPTPEPTPTTTSTPQP